MWNLEPPMPWTLPGNSLANRWVVPEYASIMLTTGIRTYQTQGIITLVIILVDPWIQGRLQALGLLCMDILHMGILHLDIHHLDIHHHMDIHQVHRLVGDRHHLTCMVIRRRMDIIPRLITIQAGTQACRLLDGNRTMVRLLDILDIIRHLVTIMVHHLVTIMGNLLCHQMGRLGRVRHLDPHCRTRLDCHLP